MILLLETLTEVACKLIGLWINFHFQCSKGVHLRSKFGHFSKHDSRRGTIPNSSPFSYARTKRSFSILKIDTTYEIFLFSCEHEDAMLIIFYMQFEAHEFELGTCAHAQKYTHKQKFFYFSLLPDAKVQNFQVRFNTI